MAEVDLCFGWYQSRAEIQTPTLPKKRKDGAPKLQSKAGPPAFEVLRAMAGRKACLPSFSPSGLHSVTVVRLRNSPLTEPCSAFTGSDTLEVCEKDSQKECLAGLPAFAAPVGAQRIRARARKSRVQNDFEAFGIDAGAGFAPFADSQGHRLRGGRSCGQARGRRAAFQYPRPITPRRASSWSPKNLTPRKVIRCCRWARRDCSATAKRGSNCLARFRWWPLADSGFPAPCFRGLSIRSWPDRTAAA